uniref:Calponin-homology (CH) domain-containing protein n=1 Tax=Caenorhabditis tropicalis TaxID=1561998 RepID=A0A1I7TJA8_9PELO
MYDSPTESLKAKTRVMLTFSWTGKRKKKSDAVDHAMAVSKHRSTSDHDSSEPSVSRSTTSTGSIHFGQTTSYTSTVGTSFKEAEYSGRLLLHGLRLSEFPSEAFSNIELLDIVFIDLSDNRMSTLPADFSAFDCLISCIASSNRFRTIPTCICSLEQLTYLDFSFNEISHLPDGMFDLPLTALILAGNKITCIPEGIRRLAPTLAYLDLSRNEIRSLQSQLRYLKELKVLKLSKNRIEEFPAELCSSLELRTLDLTQNNISYLPADFVKMTDLRHLHLECNPMRSPPMEIVELGIVHIFKWLDGRTSGCSSMSAGSQDGLLDQKRTPTTLMTIVAEKHAPHNESRTSRNTSEPPKQHHPVENGRLNHRPKELVEPKTISSVHAKPHNVQIVQNKISSVPSHMPAPLAGKENSRQSTPDEQNNNNTEMSKPKLGSLSSPGMSKKPISKVAPMMKPASRPVPNGNIQSKIGTARRPNPIQSTTVTRSTNTTTAKKEIPVKTTKIASTTTRRSEEPAAPKITSRPITSSVTNLNKSGLRVPSTGVQNDVENARKLLREKLGPSFALNKGDISFSLQLSDGQELCKFVNKLRPDAISLASPTDSSIATTRSKMNVDKFLQYCKKLGVPETTLCSQMDIISKRNPQKVARTVLTVAKLQQLQSSSVNSIQC